jgi:hypothetical protein
MGRHEHLIGVLGDVGEEHAVRRQLPSRGRHLWGHLDACAPDVDRAARSPGETDRDQRTLGFEAPIPCFERKANIALLSIGGDSHWQRPMCKETASVWPAELSIEVGQVLGDAITRRGRHAVEHRLSKERREVLTRDVARSICAKPTEKFTGAHPFGFALREAPKGSTGSQLLSGLLCA